MKNHLTVVVLLAGFFSQPAMAQSVDKEIRVPFHFAVGKSLYEKIVVSVMAWPAMALKKVRL